MIAHRFRVALPGGLEARAVFTDRSRVATGGSSRSPFDYSNLATHVGDSPRAVEAARASLARELGVRADALAFMAAAHGNAVALVADERGIGPDAEIRGVDALITKTEGIGVVALGADCCPVLLVDSVAGIVAAVHSGWRGLVADVIGAAIAAIEAAGGSAESVRAWLGPAICGSCYRVPSERAESVRAEYEGAVILTADGQPGIDVRLGLIERLNALGVPSELLGGCTHEDTQLFSFRRDGITGRQAGAIALVAR